MENKDAIRKVQRLSVDDKADVNQFYKNWILRHGMNVQCARIDFEEDRICECINKSANTIKNSFFEIVFVVDKVCSISEMFPFIKLSDYITIQNRKVIYNGANNRSLVG
jgi:hypothetical protein